MRRVSWNHKIVHELIVIEIVVNMWKLFLYRISALDNLEEIDVLLNK